MSTNPKSSTHALLIWVALATIVVVPIALAGLSPLLAWREPVYIVAGLAGIVAMAFILVQPLLVGGYLPGLPGFRGRRVHRMIGGILVMAVVIHVAGLWITSPPDVIDALMFNSPTPFSAWGVVAMWAVFAAALVAIFHRRIGLGPRVWRFVHAALVATVVPCGIIHALLIEGTMELITKTVLCALVGIATAKVLLELKPWAGLTRRGG